jgi:hypothetical protein
MRETILVKHGGSRLYDTARARYVSLEEIGERGASHLKFEMPKPGRTQSRAQ